MRSAKILNVRDSQCHWKQWNNTTSGIAVGVSCDSPPHNLSELYKACQRIIRDSMDGKETSLEDLLQDVKGPDYPTGGQLINPEDLKSMYETGCGRIVLRSKYTIEDLKKRQAIVFTELPYQVNKATTVEKIAELCRNKDLTGIYDLRDESSEKEGIRLVIELDAGVQPEWLLRQLFKKTALQSTFGVQMRAILNEQPVLLNLKSALECFLQHGMDVIHRRSLFEQNKAKARLHIVEGLIAASKVIDAVIATVRSSEDRASAAVNLRNEFGFTEIQATAIVAMDLGALTRLSGVKFQTEEKALNDQITDLQDIIENPMRCMTELEKEILEMQKKFADERRTEICMDSLSTSDLRDMVQEMDLVYLHTDKGLVKCVEAVEYAKKGRGTKGVQSGAKQDDSIRFMLHLNSKDDLLFFTSAGRCWRVPVYKIPVATRTAMGKLLSNYLSVPSGETIVSVLSCAAGTKGDLLLFTRNGIVKRISTTMLSKKQYTTVITTKENDSLVSVLLGDSSTDVILTTQKGMALRFTPEANLRAQGRAAAGVRGMKLTENDKLVDALLVGESPMLIITEKGMVKRLEPSELSPHGRGTKGQRCMRVLDNDNICSVILAGDDQDLFLATSKGLVSRISADSIRVSGRNSQGVKAINLGEEDMVVTVSTCEKEESSDE